MNDNEKARNRCERCGRIMASTTTGGYQILCYRCNTGLKREINKKIVDHAPDTDGLLYMNGVGYLYKNEKDSFLDFVGHVHPVERLKELENEISKLKKEIDELKKSKKPGPDFNSLPLRRF